MTSKPREVQGGVGGGKRKGKSLSVATATSFSGEMRRRNRTVATKICKFSAWRGGPESGGGSGEARHKSKEPLLYVTPAWHSTEDRSKSHWEGSHPCFSTTSALCEQQRKTETCHLAECQNKQEMVITSEEKQGLELRPDHRGHLSNTISSLFPFFIKILHKYPLKQTH